MNRWVGFLADLARANLGRAAPFKLTYIVTDECSCRCAICNLWQNPRKGATLGEIEQLFQANRGLSWINLSGGEVVERSDFAEIVAAAVRETRVFALDFPTAGQFPERVEAGVRAALETDLPRLFVTVSIDGPRLLHDRLRGTEGAFDRAIDTVQRLRRIEDRRLSVYVGLTFSSRNDHDPERVVNELLGDAPALRRDDLHYNVAHFAPHYYRNRPSDAPDSSRVGAFLASEHRRRNDAARSLFARIGRAFDPFAWLEATYWRLTPSYLEDGKSPVPCAALTSTAFVDPELRLYPCATWDRPLAHLPDVGYSLVKAIAQAEAQTARREAERRECPGCWTPCEAYPALLTRVPRSIASWTRRVGVDHAAPPPARPVEGAVIPVEKRG